MTARAHPQNEASGFSATLNLGKQGDKLAEGESTPTMRFKHSQFLKTAKFGGPSQEDLHCEAPEQQPAGTLKVPIPSQIHNNPSQSINKKIKTNNPSHQASPATIPPAELLITQALSPSPTKRLFEEFAMNHQVTSPQQRYERQSNTTPRRVHTIEFDRSSSLLNQAKDPNKQYEQQRQSPAINAADLQILVDHATTNESLSRSSRLAAV